jgi:hypothetical protein
MRRGKTNQQPAGLIRGDMTPKPVYERLKKLIGSSKKPFFGQN